MFLPNFPQTEIIGLGIRRFEIFSQALLVKWLWMFALECDIRRGVPSNTGSVCGAPTLAKVLYLTTTVYGNDSELGGICPWRKVRHG